LYEGSCVDYCLPSSMLTSSTCVDFSTNLTSKTISKLFVNQVNYLFVLDPGYLIKNGLTSSTFGENEIKGYGIIIRSSYGFGPWSDSLAMTT